MLSRSADIPSREEALDKIQRLRLPKDLHKHVHNKPLSLVYQQEWPPRTDEETKSQRSQITCARSWNEMDLCMLFDSFWVSVLTSRAFTAMNRAQVDATAERDDGQNDRKDSSKLSASLAGIWRGESYLREESNTLVWTLALSLACRVFLDKLYALWASFSHVINEPTIIRELTQ